MIDEKKYVKQEFSSNMIFLVKERFLVKVVFVGKKRTSDKKKLLKEGFLFKQGFLVKQYFLVKQDFFYEKVPNKKYLWDKELTFNFTPLFF